MAEGSYEHVATGFDGTTSSVGEFFKRNYFVSRTFVREESFCLVIFLCTLTYWGTTSSVGESSCRGTILYPF